MTPLEEARAELEIALKNMECAEAACRKARENAVKATNDVINGWRRLASASEAVDKMLNVERT